MFKNTMGGLVKALDRGIKNGSWNIKVGLLDKFYKASY